VKAQFLSCKSALDDREYFADFFQCVTITIIVHIASVFDILSQNTV